VDQKKQLIDIVLNLFQEQGANFKMDDVAKAMKISKKTIYKEYGNKETLIIFIVKAIFKGIEHKLSIIMEDDSYNTLEKLIHVNCAFPDVKEIDYHKALMLKNDFREPYDMFIHYIEDNWDLNRQLFTQAIQEGYIKPIDFDVYKMIMLGITKYVLESAFDDQEIVLERCVRQVFEGLIV
jgi:AcrR family transcriptional regulator